MKRLNLLYLALLPFSTVNTANISQKRIRHSSSDTNLIKPLYRGTENQNKQMNMKIQEEDISKVQSMVDVIKFKKEEHETIESLENDNYHLVAQYIWPPVCETCLDDFEQILVFCFGLTYIGPETQCWGALVYAQEHCAQCICEKLDHDLEPAWDDLLCNMCPELSQCNVPMEQII